jgi:hypothetical protein
MDFLFKKIQLDMYFMSIKEKTIDRPTPNYAKFLPKVITRNGDYIFHPGFIYQSLLKETDLSKIDAQKITEGVMRFLISASLKLITAPLIREVVNVHLLKNGFEKERLQYTRIGLPVYDLKEILDNNDEGNEEVISKIMNWIVWEYHAVNKLIQQENGEGEK